ncbi:unnamed protein product [Rotaria magnacalcarata]
MLILLAFSHLLLRFIIIIIIIIISRILIQIQLRSILDRFSILSINMQQVLPSSSNLSDYIGAILMGFLLYILALFLTIVIGILSIDFLIYCRKKIYKNESNNNTIKNLPDFKPLKPYFKHWYNDTFPHKIQCPQYLKY